MPRYALFAVFMILPFLHGCVGMGFVYGKERECTNPTLMEKATISCDPSKAELLTKRALMQKWGEPDGKQVNGSTEHWTYKIDTGYIGIVPMLGIGIPLILPLRNNRIILTLESENLTKATTIQTDWSGYMCGLLNENGRIGCSTLGK